MKTEAKEVLEGGSKGKMGGGVSKKIRLLQQAIDEEKQAADERQSKGRVDESENRQIKDRKVTKRNRGKLIVHLDGTVTGNRKRKRSEVFEEYMLKNMIKYINQGNEPHTLERMSRWVELNGKAVCDLIEDVDLSRIPTAELREQGNTSLTMLKALGLDCILHVYCERGKNFEFRTFAESMSAISVNCFVSLKIHHVLEKWRELVSDSSQGNHFFFEL